MLALDLFEDFVNNSGYISKPIAGGTALLLSNPLSQGYYVGVVNLQAVAGGDEISINLLYDTTNSPIDGQATIDLGGGPFQFECRASLGTIPTAIDDANIEIGARNNAALGFGLGPGNFGNQNWWAIGVAGPDIDTGILATAAITKFRIQHDPVTDTATWYINDVLVATKIAAGLNGVSYRCSCHVENISNTSGQLFLLVDYIHVKYSTVR